MSLQPYKPALRRDLKGRAAIAQMADDMIDIASLGGNATRDDLVRKGWRRDQLDAHGAAANEIASDNSIKTLN